MHLDLDHAPDPPQSQVVVSQNLFKVGLQLSHDFIHHQDGHDFDAMAPALSDFHTLLQEVIFVLLDKKRLKRIECFNLAMVHVEQLFLLDDLLPPHVGPRLGPENDVLLEDVAKVCVEGSVVDFSSALRAVDPGEVVRLELFAGNVEVLDEVYVDSTLVVAELGVGSFFRHIGEFYLREARLFLN